MYARSVRAGRIVVDFREPTLELATRHGGPFIDSHEHALGYRKGRGIATGRLQGLLQDRYRGLEFCRARSTRAHPAVGERRRPPHRVRMAGSHPQRRTRLAHWPRGELHVLDLKDLPAIGDLVLGP